MANFTPLTPQDIASASFGAAFSYAPMDAQNVVFHAEAITGTALDAYSTASGVLNTLSQSGVDLTGDQAKKQTQAIAEGLMLIPVVGTAIGGALLAITNAVGYAHAGAGRCATDAPLGPGLGDLKASPYYIDWAHSPANNSNPGPAWVEGSDAPGSFEDIANRALAYNRALMDNCYSSLSHAPMLILSQAIASWNATHTGPSRLVSRRMASNALIETMEQPGYDPIAYALEDGINNLHGQFVSFPINAGPRIVHINLTAHPQSVSSSTSSTTAPSTPWSPTKKGIVVAGGIAAVGTVVYAHTSGIGVVGVLENAWKAVRAKI